MVSGCASVTLNVPVGIGPRREAPGVGGCGVWMLRHQGDLHTEPGKGEFRYYWLDSGSYCLVWLSHLASLLVWLSRRQDVL